MARRTARNPLPEVRFASVLKAFLACLLIGGVAVGYVRQTHENTALKIQLKELNSEIMERDQQNQRLKEELVIRQSPEMLESMARHLGVDLQPPRPGQVVELTMPGPREPLIAQSDRRRLRVERRPQ